MPPSVPTASAAAPAPAAAPAEPASQESALPPGLLDFTPVPRKVNRPDGWTADLQREFIRRLAETGSPQRACIDMGKNVTGIEALYKVPSAHSFRAAWDRALAIGRSAMGLDCGPPHLDPVPGIQRRPARGPGRRPDPGPDEDFEMSEEDKLELLERLADKFLRKVEAEREARLAGQVVAADVYLRQITVLEVLFDLLGTEIGAAGPWELLAGIRRGGHPVWRIVDTPFTRFLDEVRREYWAATPGEPMRPVAFREEFLRDCGDHRVSLDLHAYGALTPPARGFTQEQWEAMDHDEQKAARMKQQREDAAEQVEWERRALAEHNAQSQGDT